MAIEKGSIDYYNTLMSGQDLERSTFISHYKDLQENISPRRGRFFETDRNLGTKRHSNIINSKATQALRVAVSGMLNGTMSPSRPWFSLESFDPDIMESAEVRDWLWKVELIIRSILNQSNFYTMAPVFLKELLLFGTSLMTHVDDFHDVARFYTHTAGSYYLGQNDRLEIDTFSRKFEWPCIQIVQKFGLKNCSVAVQDAYDKGNYNTWFKINQYVEPKNNAVKQSAFGKDKAYTSVYFEPDNKGPEKNKFLSESGFDQFPAYAARWDVTEGDIYGVDCPGMVALGDVRQLQSEEKTKGQAIQKMANPPLQGPPPVKNVAVSGMPGGLTIYEGDDTKQKLAPIYQVDPRLQELRMDMDAVERRIDNAFFVDLFLAISNMEGIQPRNQLDLSQRNEERLVQLGPVLERLHGEFLDKMVDRIFQQAVAAEILPPAPEVLQGSPLKIRFISTLAMAQRSVVTSDIERLTAYVGGLAEIGKTDALDKFNADQAVDDFGAAIGVPPKLIISDDQVAAIREERAAKQQQAETMEMASQAADMAAQAGAASTEPGTVLGDTMAQGAADAGEA